MSQEIEILGPVGKNLDLSLKGLADLVDRMRASPHLEREDLPLVHRFTPGMYIRELHLPAHVAVVTMVHKTEHPYVVSAGELLVWTKEGGVQNIKAPFCGITKPGTIRLAVTLTPVIWTTFHVTNETDMKKLEQELVLEPRTAAIELENKEQICHLL